jgi:NAD(P)-dependent dehydrogenase (short-subunit alcohol dehydrogenase family)
MTGKTVLVTGATGGIGLETARALARRGARVLVGARDAARGQAVADGIVRGGGRAELLLVDLASFASTREAAARTLAAHPVLDVLVNNAGTARRHRSLTADGHEVTWQTNFLGPFLLTRLLLPALRAAEGVRVVNVASEAHRSGRIDFANLELESGWSTYRAYANTKLANVLFTRELARREPGIAANAVHPGVIATNIWEPAPAWAVAIARMLMRRPASGARPVVRLAAAPELAGVSGRYFKRFRETPPSEAGRRDADARRLWEIAEKAVG